MNKVILPILGSGGGIIPWLFSSVPWYWRLIITLIILILVSVLYIIAFFQISKRLTNDIGNKNLELSALEEKLKSLEKKFKQEESNRKSVARMYGSCERDSDKFIADIREVKSNLYYIYVQFNQIKNKKDTDLVRELKHLTTVIDSIVERENIHARERNISHNQDY